MKKSGSVTHTTERDKERERLREREWMMKKSGPVTHTTERNKERVDEEEWSSDSHPRDKKERESG